jgi:peptide/nickel transport system permease protein
MSVTRYVARRLIFAVVQLVAIVVGCFFLMRVLPGDPVILRLGAMATPESIARVRHEMGLDLPLMTQFLNYARDVMQGDLGHSWRTANTVVSDLRLRFPATLELISFSILLAFGVAVPVGALTALRPSGWLSKGTLLYTLLAGAMPDFFIGLFLIYILYFKLGIAPPPMGRLGPVLDAPTGVTGMYVVDSLFAGDWGILRKALSHLALPVFTLAFVQAGPIMKMTRSTMLQILDGDFVHYARVCGLRTSQVVRYALRNALPPVVTLAGILYGILLGGAVLVESVFAWGGLGQYSVLAIVNADYDAIQGFVLVAAAFSLGVYLILDMIHVLVDPRVRY